MSHVTYFEDNKRCLRHNLPVKAWFGLAGACEQCYAAWDGRDPSQYEIELLQQALIWCPGCAHEQALIEDAEREVERFLDQAPRLEDLEERLV